MNFPCGGNHIAIFRKRLRKRSGQKINTVGFVFASKINQALGKQYDLCTHFSWVKSLWALRQRGGVAILKNEWKSELMDGIFINQFEGLRLKIITPNPVYLTLFTFLRSLRMRQNWLTISHFTSSNHILLRCYTHIDVMSLMSSVDQLDLLFQYLIVSVFTYAVEV